MIGIPESGPSVQEEVSQEQLQLLLRSDTAPQTVYFEYIYRMNTSQHQPHIYYIQHLKPAVLAIQTRSDSALYYSEQMEGGSLKIVVVAVKEFLPIPESAKYLGRSEEGIAQVGWPTWRVRWR